MRQLAVFALLMLVSAFSFSADCLNPVGALPGGPAGLIAVTDHLALLGNGRTLTILDISVPGQPEEISSIVFPGLVRDVEPAGGSLAFVSTGKTGLWIVDFSSPHSPNPRALFHTENYSAGALERGDNILYLLESYWTDEGPHSLLEIFDIHDPTQPVKIATLEREAIFAGLVSLGGVLAVTDSWRESLDIIDVTDASAPRFLSEFRLHSYPSGIATDGEHVFLTVTRRVLVFGLDTANTPLRIGTLDDLESYTTGIDLFDNFAFVTTEWGKGLLLDIEDPANPRLLQSIPLDASSWGATHIDDRLFVAASGKGMLEFSISSPSEPVQIGAWDTPGKMLDVALAGHFLYTAEEFSEMRVFDISDRSQPILIPQNRALPEGRRIKSFGNLLLMASGNDLFILDISDRAAPEPIGEIAVRTWDFTMKGTIAYILDSFHNTLKVYDLTHPSHPVEISDSAVSAGTLGNIVISGQYALITDPGCPFDCLPYLLIVNIQDPVHPRVEGSIILIYGADRVDVSGHRAFVAGYASMSIVDISDPATPFIQSTTALEYYAWATVFSNMGITTLVGWDRILVFNTFRVDQPILRDSLEFDGKFYGAILDGGYLYAAAGNNGLLILDECRTEYIEKPETSALN